jgi:hypothetical protein
LPSGLVQRLSSGLTCIEARHRDGTPTPKIQPTVAGTIQKFLMRQQMIDELDQGLQETA